MHSQNDIFPYLLLYERRLIALKTTMATDKPKPLQSFRNDTVSDSQESGKRLGGS